MTRWLGVDYGEKRVGIAVGDTADGMALPVEVLEGHHGRMLLDRLAELLEQYDAEGFVVGWPLNMDGTEGPQGQKTRQFASALAEGRDADVRLWDERLSSAEADRALAGHLTRNKRRRRQDAIAAAEFLGEFLRNNGPALAPHATTAEPPTGHAPWE